MRSIGEGPAVDVHLDFSRGLPPAHDQIVHEWGGRYHLRLGKIGPDWSLDSCFEGMFLVAPDGRSVQLVCPTVPPAQNLADILARRVLPRVATLFGRIAIHAASVGKGQSGLLLLGSSGAGKSSMTAALGEAGWDVLSDDISILRDDRTPLIEPSNTGICIWPDTRASLQLDSAACTAMPGYDGKVRYDPPATEHRVSPARLAACVVLQRSGESAAPRLEQLGPAEALRSAIRQLVVFNPAAPRDSHAQLIDRLAGIMSKVPAYRLTYPAEYAAFPKIADLLERLLPV